MHIIDLSQTIEPGMPVYPGTPGPLFQAISSVKEHGFAEQMLTLSSHTGTHVDLPSHILRSGHSLDAFNVERFAGKGVMVDVSGSADGEITLEVLLPFQKLIKVSDFLLFHSGWSQFWGTSSYYQGYPILSSDAALWLAAHHLKGIGVDMISVDAPDSTLFPLHTLLLQRDIIIVENLRLDMRLLHAPFTFCGFPLKIAGAEASPIRAVAFVEDEYYS